MLLEVDLSTAFTPSKLSQRSTRFEHSSASTITTSGASINKLSSSRWFRTRGILLNESGTADGEVTKGPAPTFNGSMLPLKLTRIGLKGHKVAAVYAIFDKEYKSLCVRHMNIGYLSFISLC